MDKIELKSGIEAILFASGEPVRADRIAVVLDCDEQDVLAAGAELAEEYESAGRGIRIVRLNDSLQMHSAPEHAAAITRALEQRRPPRLSPASLEVLAIVAYFQPVTRAYIEQMRGVDSSYTVGVLAERGLIEPCGHLEAVGRPTLYRTTDLFLRTVGVPSLDQLPPLPEMGGSDAAIQLQKKVDELRAAEEAAKRMARAAAEEDVHTPEKEGPEERGAQAL